MWHMLSYFYLDHEMTHEHLSWVAERCAKSPYTVEELDIIMFRDLYPALIQNRWSPVGEWLPWSEEFVVARVHKYRHKPTPVRWWQFPTWRKWNWVKRAVRRMRAEGFVPPSNTWLERTRER